MPRIRDDRPETGDAVTDAALDALDADELCALIRELLPWFDDRLHARFVNAVIDHAARNPSGWVPAPPGDAIVAEIERFADAAQRTGYADPAEVDARLRVGSNAFLARDYAGTYRIFHALLGQVAVTWDIAGATARSLAWVFGQPQRRGAALESRPCLGWCLGVRWVGLVQDDRVAGRTATASVFLQGPALYQIQDVSIGRVL